MATDYRGWIQSDPSKAWALDYVGNDYDNSATQGINSSKLANAYGGNTQTGYFDALKQLQGYANQYANSGNRVGYSTTGGASTSGSTSGTTPAVDLSLFDSNATNLNDLLGRTNTQLANGLSTINDQYNNQVTQTNTDKSKQIQGQNTAKQGAYDKINQNAGIGFKSLANIIGRSAGTGSSAYRELLPSVIGKDTSSKRLDATNNYAQNLSNIDTSFESVLQDLANQKKQNEDTLNTGVQNQQQSLNQQLAQNAIAKTQAAGGTPKQAVAAAQPFQTAITNSRNAVDNFFNQFKPTYNTPTPNLNLAQYQTDPAAVQAAQQGGDAANPYSALLRKKLQGQG